jgi:hypothetical protein
MKKLLKTTVNIIIFINCNLLISQTSENNYFPLKKGNYWLYKYAKTCTIDKRIVDFDSEKKIYILEETNKFGNLNPTKTIFAYQKTNSKILLIGMIIPPDPNFKFKLPPHIIFKYPLKIGTSWIEYDEDYEKKENKVIAFLDCVTKAGTFKKTCKIKTVLSYMFEGTLENITTYNYYAPKIGFIKQEILYKDNSVNTFLELIDYHINE